MRGTNLIGSYCRLEDVLPVVLVVSAVSLQNA